MNLTELIEKRESLLKRYNEMKEKRESEKRSTYTQEEFTEINNLNIELDEIEKTIESEKELEAKRNKKLDDIASISIFSKKDDEVVSSFRSFLANENTNNNEKFKLSFESIKRATVTTAANSNWSYQDQVPNLQIADSELILNKIGVPVYYFDSGEQAIPSLNELIGVFGTEDASNADQTFSDAKKVLKPSFVSASIEVSKVFLKSAKSETINQLMSELKLAIDKAVEKRTIDSLSSLSAVSGYGTGNTTGVTFHNAVVEMESALIGKPSAYIFSAKGIGKSKTAKLDSGSGMFVNQNNTINGYPALRSTLMTNQWHGYLVDAKAMAMAYWGDGIEVAQITDATLARKGNVLLIATALADGSYLSSAKHAVIKNVNYLS